MIDCKEPCLAVSFRFLTLAHHIYLDTCPVYILDAFSAHTLAAHLQGSQAGVPGQVCAMVSQGRVVPRCTVKPLATLHTCGMLRRLLPALLSLTER